MIQSFVVVREAPVSKSTTHIEGSFFNPGITDSKSNTKNKRN